MGVIWIPHSSYGPKAQFYPKEATEQRRFPCPSKVMLSLGMSGEASHPGFILALLAGDLSLSRSKQGQRQSQQAGKRGAWRSRVSRSKKDQIVWGLEWEPIPLLLRNMLPPTLQLPTCTHYPAEQEETALTACSLTQNPTSFSRARGSPAFPKGQVAPQGLIKGWMAAVTEGKEQQKISKDFGRRGVWPSA